VLVAGLVGGGVLAWIFGLDAGWDHLNYYHYVAWAALNGRLDVDLAPAQMQTYFDPLVVLPYYLIARGAGDHVVTVVTGAFQGLTLWLVWRIAWHLLEAQGPLWRSLMAGACALVGFYGPANLYALGGPQGDNSLAVPLLAGLLLLVRPGERGWGRLIAAGLLVGIASGAKLTVVQYGVGAVLAFPLLLGPDGAAARWRRWAAFAGATAAGFAATAGPWMAYMAARYGNPVFPLYNNVFGSEWAPQTSFVASPYTPETLPGTLVHPLVAGLQEASVWAGEGRDLRYALVFGLLIVAALVALWRRVRPPASPRPPARSLVFLGAFFGVSMLLWSRLHADLRFLSPLEALTPPVVVLCLAFVVANIKVVRIAGLLSLLAIWLVVQVPTGVRLPLDGTMFDVRVPAIGDAEGKVVVFTGDEPTAYVVPYFPEGMRFVRLGGNLAGERQPTRLTAEIRAAIEGAQGPIFAVTGPAGPNARLLGEFGLTPPGSPCLPIHTKVGDGLQLCVLDRSP